ncbi:MFS transporter [Rhodococcus sp. JS3073]|uniref:MFS transporter n=1 Tax=Rhodococcus sp. JS3073 TaxID=3002901 RepID=UPI0022861CD2|nr:MFS transporter [Rhodococcus sp. JS3073]WAM14765.1 MFS transporter [Rhodococcus sp. JS3073]
MGLQPNTDIGPINVVRDRYAPSGRVIVILTVTAITAVGQMYSVLALLPQMAATFRVDPAHVTATSTVFGVAYALGFLAAGPLASRFGPHTVMTVGLFAAAVTTLLAALPSTLLLELIARAGQGCAAAAFAPAAFTYIAESIDPRHRLLALSCLTSGFLAAAAVVPVAAQMIAAAAGWRAVFVVGAGALVVTTVAVATLVPRARPRGHPCGTRLFGVLVTILGRWRLVALFGAAATFLGAYVSVFTTISLVGPPSIAGNPEALQVLRLATVPALLVIPFLGQVLRRCRPARRGAAAMGVAAMSAGGSVLSDSLVTLSITVLVLVAAISIAASAIVESLLAQVHPEETGGATALYGSFTFLGASAGPALASGISPWGFGIGMLTAALWLAIGAGLILFSAAGTVARRSLQHNTDDAVSPLR